MNIRKLFAVLALSAITSPVCAQAKPDAQPQVRPESFAIGADVRRFSDANVSPLVIPGENGASTNLADLIRSADIVIVGRYGTYLGNALFYGYADPVTGAGRSRIGIPVSEYEIIMDDALKGEHLLSGQLVVRIAEMPDAHIQPALAQYREGRHLFFFGLNPDGQTVGFNGPMFDLKEADDAFLMYVEGKEVPVPGSDPKDTFLTNVRSLARQP